MGLAEAIRRYLLVLNEKNCSPSTLSAVLGRLERLRSFLLDRDLPDVKNVLPQHLLAYRRAMEVGAPPFRKPLAPGSLQAYFLAVRGFFQFLEDQGVIFHDPTYGVTVPDPGRVAQPILTEAEVQRLLAQPDCASPLGLRDRAMLELFYSTGMRRGELLALNLRDLDVAEQVVWIRRGKGSKDRVVPVGQVALQWLLRYLVEVRGKLVRAAGEEALFVTVYGERLGSARLTDVVAEYGRRAGIGKPVCCHMLRRSCASHLLAGGADVRMVQELLGHRSLETTQVYLQWTLQQLKDAHHHWHPRERIRAGACLPGERGWPPLPKDRRRGSSH